MNQKKIVTQTSIVLYPIAATTTTKKRLAPLVPFKWDDVDQPLPTAPAPNAFLSE